MTFLLDTNICSVHLRESTKLVHRFNQYSGRLAISSVVLAELYTWAFGHPNPNRILDAIAALLRLEVEVLPFEESCAKEFGRLRVLLQRRGVTVPPMDLMIAATALAHDLTLVTHNTADFQAIPNLHLQDWLAP